MQKIDAMGGAVAAIEQGFMQNEIARSAYDYQRHIESGEKIIVGVNKFVQTGDAPIPVFRVDDSIRQQQVEKLQALKRGRDAVQIARCLESVRQKGVSGENLMPAVIEAVEKGCTLGEVADVLRGVFGEF